MFGEDGQGPAMYRPPEVPSREKLQLEALGPPVVSSMAASLRIEGIVADICGGLMTESLILGFFYVHFIRDWTDNPSIIFMGYLVYQK